MSTRRHGMPFGAQLEPGGVRFRLWAPAAARVELVLAAEQFAMTPVGDGFFELTTASAAAGSRYGFRIDGRDLVVPDPASRSNPEDVHAASEVVDPAAFQWTDDAWRGRPWDESVVYELHVGTFNASGDFTGVEEKLPYLTELGVTAIELMPVAEFAGVRGWGYDGVLPFAPESGYGGPEPLKRLIQAAHAHGIMVLLDVVYNHFGPEGNYLHLYAPQFFTDRVHTPWGQAIDFEGGSSDVVRDFFVHNALYWLEEYNLDGLRIDAVHAIHDRSSPCILEELADRVRAATPSERHVHLVLENDRNESHYLRSPARGEPPRYRAQWNDDFHHPLHVLLTDERDGYYADYADDPLAQLGRALAEGFAFQGQRSEYRDAARGEPSTDLPSSAFVAFLQNHDQVGNRALGERLPALTAPGPLAAAQALLLLGPQPPMLFMGEELGATSPFPYFCDFPAELGEAVAAGRRRQFRHFAGFETAAARERIPHPNSPETFAAAQIDWSEAQSMPHAAEVARYRELLRLRHEWLVPHLPALAGKAERRENGLDMHWRLASGAHWRLVANFDEQSILLDRPAGSCIYGAATGAVDDATITIPGWSVAAFLVEA